MRHGNGHGPHRKRLNPDLLRTMANMGGRGRNVEVRARALNRVERTMTPQPSDEVQGTLWLFREARRILERHGPRHRIRLRMLGTRGPGKRVRLPVQLPGCPAEWGPEGLVCERENAQVIGATFNVADVVNYLNAYFNRHAPHVAQMVRKEDRR